MKETQNINAYLNKHISDFRKLGKIQQITAIVIMISLFFFGVYSSQLVFPASKPSKTDIVLSPTPIPLPANLSLVTGNKTVDLNATFSATLMIDSPTQGIEAADFVVDFDPDYLKIATISAGNYFSLYPVMKIGTNSAKISGIANLVNGRFTIPIGKGKIADIVFTSLDATDGSTIKINKEKTFVGSAGFNILGKTNDLEMIIK